MMFFFLLILSGLDFTFDIMRNNYSILTIEVTLFSEYLKGLLLLKFLLLRMEHVFCFTSFFLKFSL